LASSLFSHIEGFPKTKSWVIGK